MLVARLSGAENDSLPCPLTYEAPAYCTVTAQQSIISSIACATPPVACCTLQDPMITRLMVR